MTELRLRYWAAARSAVGHDEESYAAGSVGEALASAEREHPELAAVLPVATLLVDGHRTTGEATRQEIEALGGPHAVVEILPPFSGG